LANISQINFAKVSNFLAYKLALLGRYMLLLSSFSQKLWITKFDRFKN